MSATASSGLPVSFGAAGACTVLVDEVSLTGAAGTCTITASQAGNDNWNAATPVDQSFEVTGTHTISGTVTGSGGPLDNPRVHVFDATSGAYVTTAVPVPGGAYTVTLVVGHLQALGPAQHGRLRRHLVRRAGLRRRRTLDINAADATADMTLVGIFTHTISGTVTGSGGPLDNPRVHVFDATSGAYVTTAVPVPGGAYTVTLGSGTYKLWVQPNTAGYYDTWYGGPDFAGADTLDINAADATADMTLVGIFTHTISGTVTGSGGALDNPRVHVFDATSGAYVTTAVPVPGAPTRSLSPRAPTSSGSSPTRPATTTPGTAGPDFAGAETLDINAG